MGGFEQRLDLVDDSLTIEAGHGKACSTCETLAECRVVVELKYGVGKSRGGPLDEESGPVVLKNLCDATDRSSDDGRTGKHRFDEDEREGLILGEDGDDIDGGEVCRQILDKASEVDLSGPASVIDLAPELTCKLVVPLARGADEQKFELSARRMLAEGGGGGDEEILPLEWRDLAENGDGQGACQAKLSPGNIPRQEPFRAGIDPVGNDLNPVGKGGKGGHQLRADGLRDSDQRGGGADGPGVEEAGAPKRVEMVAGKEKAHTGGEPGGETTDEVVATDVRLKDLDSLPTKKPDETAKADGIEGVAQWQLVKCHRPAIEGAAKRASWPDGEV